LIGGIPIVVDGQIVGGVGVSGAATADQDEKLAIAGSKAFELATASGDLSPAVSYWEKSKVEEAFSKGAILFDGSDGRNYMVHASRREKPGQSEIHTKDADIIYVLQGSATFITGGEAIDAKPTEPNELRGSAINGGETRKIAKGDVIIVPHGVPHQFLEVTDPFLYYVVKVR
jgi:glc operon protein GlcG